ncbi:probable serine/threonine-protein kinase PBL11 [Aristolochia californica]|uniref:probable serine/threonine-protein kinase PBL11 n=1 Tax=Aristolochia californica TaxID=171875 RepID=UPI0035E12673
MAGKKRWVLRYVDLVFDRGFEIDVKRKMKPGCLQIDVMNLRRFQLVELEKATRNFSRECMVGSGAFGNVFRGTFEGGWVLAIKKAHEDSYQSVQEFRNGKIFLAEVELLSRMKHKNLLDLVGFCDELGQTVLVYEYIANGSLLDYLIGRRGRSLTWRQRVNIAIGAAKGITHLHEGIKPGIIHRDIKPSNILIGDGFEAKVSDFGLVKSGPIGDKSHVSSQIKGTPGYLDPAYCSSFHLTPFSDVYSFGVILLQLVTGRPAVGPGRNASQHHIVDWARSSIEEGNIGDVLDANLLLQPCNMEMMLKMGELGLRCTEKIPRRRPTMAQICEELEEALRSTESFIDSKHPTSSFRSEDEDSQSFVSIDGAKLQRFRVEMESMSFQSPSMKAFEISSVSLDMEKKVQKITGGIIEEDDTRKTHAYF